MLRMKCFVFVSMAMLLCGAITPSQPRLNEGRQPKFSSVYTDLKRDCKWDKAGAEAKTCKGYNGYSVRIWYPGALGRYN
jgi:hypothetical protein